MLIRLIWTKWRVIKTIWPYREGYGTFRTNRWTKRIVILDLGLTREEAVRRAHELNS